MTTTKKLTLEEIKELLAKADTVTPWPDNSAVEELIAAAPTIIAQLIEQVEQLTSQNESMQRRLFEYVDDINELQSADLLEWMERFRDVNTMYLERSSENEKLRAERDALLQRLDDHITWSESSLDEVFAERDQLRAELNNIEEQLHTSRVEAHKRNAHLLELLREIHEWADGYQNPKTGMGSGLHAEKWPSLNPSARKLMLQIVERADFKLSQALGGDGEITAYARPEALAKPKARKPMPESAMATSQPGTDDSKGDGG